MPFIKEELLLHFQGRIRPTSVLGQIWAEE